MLQKDQEGEPTQIRLPAHRAKQAESLSQNVMALVTKFGIDKIGFVTLTIGNYARAGNFEGVREPKEASRRYNSAMTNFLKEEFLAGVTVIEPHKSKALHFHTITALRHDIRTGFDWEAFDRLKGHRMTAGDVGASSELAGLWKWLRDGAPRYGFGRCQILPVRSNAEAIGRYAGKYISKGFALRIPEMKGVRLVRYFGHWDTRPAVNRPAKPPWSARHGRMTESAIAWRACMKQVQIQSRLQGREVTPENVRQECGRHWAFWMTPKMNATIFVEPDKFPHQAKAIKAHNDRVNSVDREFKWGRWSRGEEVPGIWTKERSFWKGPDELPPLPPDPEINLWEEWLQKKHDEVIDSCDAAQFWWEQRDKQAAQKTKKT